MEKYDKTKIALFVVTLILLVISITLGIFNSKLTNENKKLLNKYGQLDKQEEVRKEFNSDSDKKLIIDFYTVLYNYKDNPSNVDKEKFVEMLSDKPLHDVYTELNASDEIGDKVKTSSQLDREDIKILEFKSENQEEHSYLVTLPLNMTFEDVMQNKVELSQLVTIKDGKIIDRAVITTPK
ncbi:hypothetical protein ACODGV_12210 [Vagococcus fluvialis]|uniref:hypothetical protein n=1 Tax=Vagococcus fluvialis TaxID=2738 RepID=UPI003B2284A2